MLDCARPRKTTQRDENVIGRFRAFYTVVRSTSTADKTASAGPSVGVAYVLVPRQLRQTPQNVLAGLAVKRNELKDPKNDIGRCPSSRTPSLLAPTLTKSEDAEDSEDADADAEEFLVERLLLALFRFDCFDCAALLLPVVIVTSMDELEELKLGLDLDESLPVIPAALVATFSKL
jgi:hypothetical protein